MKLKISKYLEILFLKQEAVHQTGKVYTGKRFAYKLYMRIDLENVKNAFQSLWPGSHVQ